MPRAGIVPKQREVTSGMGIEQALPVGLQAQLSERSPDIGCLTRLRDQVDLLRFNFFVGGGGFSECDREGSVGDLFECLFD